MMTKMMNLTTSMMMTTIMIVMTAENYNFEIEKNWLILATISIEIWSTVRAIRKIKRQYENRIQERRAMGKCFVIKNFQQIQQV